MLPEKDRIRLTHIVQYASEAMSFASGRTRADLDTDRPLAHALVRCLEVAGEAAAQVSPATRDGLPQIPWRAIISMRNRLIHAYHLVNLDIVWKAVTVEFPPIVAELERILRQS
ncbi:MAG: DUF86 domain-containing protein [Armatimonadetes bacterium]|nr:DUF86 domain-containing protein [Armatimonadota bacterium]